MVYLSALAFDISFRDTSPYNPNAPTLLGFILWILITSLVLVIKGASVTREEHPVAPISS
jgi:hypothetical protein